MPDFLSPYDANHEPLVKARTRDLRRFGVLPGGWLS